MWEASRRSFWGRSSPFLFRAAPRCWDPCLRWESLFRLSGPGFQLSFGAVVGLFLFVHPLENRLHFLPEGVATGVAVSAAATLGTAPVALVAFGQVSLVGVAA